MTAYQEWRCTVETAGYKEAFEAATLIERERQAAVLLSLQALPSMTASERLLLGLCIMAIKWEAKS